MYAEVFEHSETLPPETTKDVLRSLFTDIMHAEDVIVKRQITSLIHRLTQSSSDKRLIKFPRIDRRQEGTLTVTQEEISMLGDVMVALNDDFPNDIGVIMPVILNYLQLEPGMSMTDDSFLFFVF